MSPAPKHRTRLFDARGGVSWVSLVLLLAFGSAVYLGWVWVPVWILRFEVNQVVRDYMNQAVKNRDDAGLKQKMVQKIRSLLDEEQVDEGGRVQKVPAIDLRVQDVTWERDTGSSPPMLHVQFEWTRTIAYPFIDRSVEQTYQVDFTEDMQIPDWGPAR